MKVSVVRSGGFAGTTKSWEVSIDDLGDRESWLALIDRLPWDDTPVERQKPDAFSYRIQCSTHRIVLPEHQLVGHWRELVERVQKAS
ncbi:MAG: protealysin inhibitor emfourin [Lacisediminihabitans sp.]